MFYREAGQFKANYQADAAIFPIRQDRIALVAVALVAFVGIPLFATPYAFTGIPGTRSTKLYDAKAPTAMNAAVPSDSWPA